MKHKSKFILAALISLLGFTASLVDLSEVDVQLPAFFDEWTSQEQISAEETSIDAGSWQTFSDLDSLNRVGVANAMLHRSMMPTEERGDISNVYPTGWNQKKLENNVWLYNRSHLVGFQMTGENDNWKNLFTGTQQLNQIHMVQYENEVANYLRKTNNHVRYRVTPIFREQELLPRAIQMEAQSIENNDVQFNVLIHNIQNGVSIDYQTGKATNP